MQKVKTVFVINREDGSIATPVPMESSKWVLEGEGVATVKFDGTSVLVREGRLFKRMDRKLTKQFGQKFRKTRNMVLELHMFKEAPEGWEPCEPEPDKKTGHWPGWVPVSEDKPEDKWHIEAFKSSGQLENGTYELVGPKIQANPYGLETHELWKHGSTVVEVPRTFEGIREWLEANDGEGLVFHHPDGRMSKVRRKDFGIKWQ